MYYTGFADEAGAPLDTQIKATKELGWKFIETRTLFGKNLAEISEAEFEEVQQKLSTAGVSFNCYGSGIANWAKPIDQSPQSSYDEFRRVIPRMQKLGIKMVRMMSFAVPKEIVQKNLEYGPEVIKRLKIIVKMAEDAGIICVHENCMNWGGLSFEHTLRIIDKINSQNFKLVFDTGNPVFADDVRGKSPYRKQNAFEFYENVREHIAYIHVKDGYMDGEKMIFTYPDEGKAEISRILEDAFRRGYDGGISIEPHMALVFHDKDQNMKDKEKLTYDNYVEYGRRTMKIVDKIKSHLGKN